MFRSLLASVVLLTFSLGTSAATVRMNWVDASSNSLDLLAGLPAEMDIWVDLIAGEELSGINFSNVSVEGIVRTALTVHPNGWARAPVDGFPIGVDEQVSFSALSSLYNLAGPGSFKIGTQTVRLEKFQPSEILPIAFAHPVWVLDGQGTPYTWNALRHTTDPEFVAYGDYGNEGWESSPPGKGQPTANPLYAHSIHSPDQLSVSAGIRSAGHEGAMIHLELQVGAGGITSNGTVLIEFPRNRGFSLL
ncbi:MAG: hypothetical protein H6816_13200 [Phycisphaerales bacterium]|nr:hypothetical protein [Phycisphaerales bacterium]